ncbi:hypothetical protein UFOVP606_34 [uncultured Caudovirales phage]|uniref:Uncharacterized protein n=1 Tax=uncultured Caudovirales phage TaxID=2100421 RepID=A0A6J5N2K9_9CAUD|nr:hypothetical protein UFOVP606_34 [uncultured Caudovirales phage]
MTKLDRVNEAKIILRSKYKQVHISDLMELSKDYWNKVMTGKKPMTTEHLKKLKKLKLI